MLKILKDSISKRAEVDMDDVGITKNRIEKSFELFIPGDEYLGITDKQFDIFNIIEKTYIIKDWEFTQKKGDKSELRIRFDMDDELTELIILLTEKMDELKEIDYIFQRKENELRKIQKQIEVCISE